MKNSEEANESSSKRMMKPYQAMMIFVLIAGGFFQMWMNYAENCRHLSDFMTTNVHMIFFDYPFFNFNWTLLNAYLLIRRCLTFVATWSQ